MLYCILSIIILYYYYNKELSCCIGDAVILPNKYPEWIVCLICRMNICCRRINYWPLRCDFKLNARIAACNWSGWKGGGRKLVPASFVTVYLQLRPQGSQDKNWTALTAIYLFLFHIILTFLNAHISATLDELNVYVNNIKKLPNFCLY